METLNTVQRRKPKIKTLLVGYRPSLVNKQYLESIKKQNGNMSLNTLLELLVSAIREDDYTIINSLKKNVGIN